MICESYRFYLIITSRVLNQISKRAHYKVEVTFEYMGMTLTVFGSNPITGAAVVLQTHNDLRPRACGAIQRAPMILRCPI